VSGGEPDRGASGTARPVAVRRKFSLTGTFRDELLYTSRAALSLLLEHLVELLVDRRGGRSTEARNAVLTALGHDLAE